jgi:hypothetical protein
LVLFLLVKMKTGKPITHSPTIEPMAIPAMAPPLSLELCDKLGFALSEATEEDAIGKRSIVKWKY